MQRATCNAQHAARNMQRATCNAQHATNSYAVRSAAHARFVRSDSDQSVRYLTGRAKRRKHIVRTFPLSAFPLSAFPLSPSQTSPTSPDRPSPTPPVRCTLLGAAARPPPPHTPAAAAVSVECRGTRHTLLSPVRARRHMRVRGQCLRRVCAQTACMGTRAWHARGGGGNGAPSTCSASSTLTGVRPIVCRAPTCANKQAKIEIEQTNNKQTTETKTTKQTTKQTNQRDNKRNNQTNNPPAHCLRRNRCAAEQSASAHP
jgi:hypothetical protein